MKLAIIFFFLLLNLASATSFTEFYVNPNAAAGCTNVNSGSTSTGTATYTSTATAAGGWNSAGTFTPDDGSTPASTVSAGMFASIYTNGVNTNATFIGRITAVAAGVNGAITVSITAKAGTVPTTVAGSVAAITVKVGGTWTGPRTNAAGGASVTFPFNFASQSLTNASGDPPCYNFIGGTNYNTSNAITHSVNGTMRWEGYTNAPHDGGKATISGGSTVAGFILMTISAQRNDWVNLIWQNNGASGTSDGVSVSGQGNFFQGCVFNGMRGSGAVFSALPVVVECEASTNNLSNTASKAGFDNSVANTVYLRCVGHDNTNALASGIIMIQPATLIDCIWYRNGLNGITATTTGDPIIIINNDLYWNAGSGYNMSGSVPAVSQLIYVENSNALTNGAFSFNSSTAGTRFFRNGGFFNNGFGSGNRTNASGFGANLTNVFSAGAVTYASGVTPWVAPDTGDFRINLAAAYGTGRGAFLQTAVGLTNNLVGFPSIGAVQPAGFTNTTAAAFAQ